MASRDWDVTASMNSCMARVELAPFEGCLAVAGAYLADLSLPSASPSPQPPQLPPLRGSPPPEALLPYHVAPPFCSEHASATAAAAALMPSAECWPGGPYGAYPVRGQQRGPLDVWAHAQPPHAMQRFNFGYLQSPGTACGHFATGCALAGGVGPAGELHGAEQYCASGRSTPTAI
jgi:hypothetical protein